MPTPPTRPGTAALQFDLFGGPDPKPAGPARRQRRFVHGPYSFDYELHRASRRSIGIRIDDATVRVSAPRWVGLAQIEQVLADKAEWVVRQLRLHDQRPRIEWVDGARLPYLGGELRLRLAGAAASRPLLDEASRELLLPLAPDSAAQVVRAATQSWMREQALRRFTARAHEFARVLGVRVTAVGLSSARTRWGSAGVDGRLRLHWRLLHFAPHIVDYVIAHEVAHLREMNHGPRFWAVVAELFPRWREAREALRASVLPAW